MRPPSRSLRKMSPNSYDSCDTASARSSYFASFTAALTSAPYFLAARMILRRRRPSSSGARRRTGKDPLPTARLPEEMIATLTAGAAEEGVSRSELLRRLVELGRRRRGRMRSGSGVSSERRSVPFWWRKAKPYCFVDGRKARPYVSLMIKSFKNKALQRFFETGKPRGLSVQDDRRVARILRALENASLPAEMDIPGYRFHALSGDRKGRYSVRVTGNWRITFGWDGENVTDVDMEDYH